MSAGVTTVTASGCRPCYPGGVARRGSPATERWGCVMADDAATSAGQNSDTLELQELRARYAAAQAEIAALRQREAEAQEQHTATADILRAIATSKAALTPVFEAVAERAYRLCHASS